MIRATHVAATLVVAGLAAGTMLTLNGEEAATTANIPVDTTQSRPRATRRAVRVATTPETAPVPIVEERPDNVLALVDEGLAAWGRFAVSGDLGELEPWFDHDGPQYGRLASEAKELAAQPLGPPPYSVVMFDPVVEAVGDEVRVSGRVVFARTGEPSQSFDWRLIVRGPVHDRRIWTVEDVPAP